MQIGVDSFARRSAKTAVRVSESDVCDLVEQIEHADQAGWTSSASENIIVGNSWIPRRRHSRARRHDQAHTSHECGHPVLSAADPVRVFRSSPHSTFTQGGRKWLSAGVRLSTRFRCSALPVPIKIG